MLILHHDSNALNVDEGIQESDLEKPTVKEDKPESSPQEEKYYSIL